MQNAAFVARTRQRAVSYWDCYYRNLFPDLGTYPSLPILTSIMTAAAEPDLAADSMSPGRFTSSDGQE